MSVTMSTQISQVKSLLILSALEEEIPTMNINKMENMMQEVLRRTNYFTCTAMRTLLSS